MSGIRDIAIIVQFEGTAFLYQRALCGSLPVVGRLVYGTDQTLEIAASDLGSRLRDGD